MNKQVVKSEYEIQAENFLQKHGIAFSARFLYHGPHWEGDKDHRNVWELTLSKGTGKGQQLDSKFGQSIADSFLWPQKQFGHLVRYHDKRRDQSRYGEAGKSPWHGKTPTAYDLLACLTKYDPGSFEDFCGEFGYDNDSRKAERTYLAVQSEWHKVNRFFTKEQLEELQDIQ